MILRLTVLGAIVLLLAVPARAQESREEVIAQAQAEKARELRPYAPNKAEAILKQAQDLLILSPNGFFPVFGSVYSGGGFTLGAGYRQYIGDRLNWTLSGLYSFKGYKLIELGFRQGGTAGFGLRRQLVDQGGHPKQLLKFGEQKSLQTDRVVLVPGPTEELAVVQRIYRQFIDERCHENQIAAALN